MNNKLSERTGVIYLFESQINGKCYIGQTINWDQRLKDHKKASGDNLFHRAIRCHDFDSFVHSFLHKNVPEKKLDMLEKYYIFAYNSYENGYNMTEGGDSNPMKNPEVRIKSSKTKKEQVLRGEYSSQRPEVQAKIKETQQKKIQDGTHHNLTDNPMWKEENRIKVSKTLREQALRGEHSSQRPEFLAKIKAIQQKKIQDGTHHNLTNNPMWKEENRIKVSKTLREQALRGEHASQRPEVQAKNKLAQQKKIQDGTHHNLTNNPMWKEENRIKVSKTLREQALRGEHSSQRPEVRAKIKEIQQKKIQDGTHHNLTNNPMWKEENRIKVSKIFKERALRGEHVSQRPEVQAKIKATQQKKIQDGTHHNLTNNPMWKKENRIKAQQTKSKNKRKNEENLGQIFLFSENLE